MDCKVIETKLAEIARCAKRAQRLLGNGNTGRMFDSELNVIELHVASIRDMVFDAALVARDQAFKP